jgi:Protein of unknown function (DUF1469).
MSAASARTDPDAGDRGIGPLQFLRLAQASSPLFADHVEFLADLAGLEWRRESERLRQVLVVAVVLAVGGLLMLALLFALALAWSWATPWRPWVALAEVVVLALVLVWAGLRLRRLSAAGAEAFSATRAELARDLALFRQRT